MTTFIGMVWLFRGNHHRRETVSLLRLAPCGNAASPRVHVLSRLIFTDGSRKPDIYLRLTFPLICNGVSYSLLLVADFERLRRQARRK